MPNTFGVPEGGPEVEGVLGEQRGSRTARVLGTLGALLGTFVVLVGSALTVDFINRHDPRTEVDLLRRQAQQFRTEILGQRFAFESAAASQRSASRILIDVLNWPDVSQEEAERDKQALNLAVDGYQSSLDNIRALLTDAVGNFRLGGDAAHPEASQLGAFFIYESLMLNRAGLFSRCLQTAVDTARTHGGMPAGQPDHSPDPSAPEGEPRPHVSDVQCPAITNARGVVHDEFTLDESALRALDDCETHFGRQLVEVARVLNHSASANGSAADDLPLTQRLGMEARRQRLWHGPQASDWSAAEADLARACEPLKQFGGAPSGQQQ